MLKLKLEEQQAHWEDQQQKRKLNEAFGEQATNSQVDIDIQNDQQINEL